jgi:predicted nucleotidyltransferase component of viral defense system
MEKDFFLSKLYPFQVELLRVINAARTGFYLSGGTAASRGYLNHRFSEDLDLFVNDDDEFPTWVDRIIESLRRQSGWNLGILRRDERFARLSAALGDVLMRIELVNDVPAHVGNIIEHPVLGRVDSAENILANKK